MMTFEMKRGTHSGYVRQMVVLEACEWAAMITTKSQRHETGNGNAEVAETRREMFVNRTWETKTSWNGTVPGCLR